MTNIPQAAKGQPMRRWSFGPAVLDERTLELRLDGRLVTVERKPLELLLFLLEHAGEVVTREELLDGVWAGRVLTDHVLTQCVRKAREALADDAQDLIKTVHGFGYRLVAPVRVEFDTPVPAARLDYKAGDRLPQRPLWNLAERLGSGGHGEAWLARHDKTREERVYKFALDPTVLASLKREVTLFRVLNDSLGDKAPIVRILDWSLEQPPFFIESQHVAGGSLSKWAERQGGIANVSLPVRLELAAQVAEALASAHAVGVLHKDLKPSNVLIEPPDRAPKVKLCDFGSGTLLDRARLDELGITRAGFTRTVNVESTSGTPLYLAPEVIAGQPHTARSDVYSAGVLLFQLVVGDLKRAPAPGWERSVPDKLLREDIAAACEGDPARRIADAAGLARRIRSLDARRTSEVEGVPETRYTQVGRDRVGYRLQGKGPPDLVYTPGLWGVMEAWDDDEGARAFNARLAAFSRLLRFDRRGSGASDPPTADGGSFVEHWIEDCAAILDAAGSQRPIILASSSSDAGPLVLKFIERYPDRCSGLIFANTTACIAQRPDYPQGHSLEVLQQIAKEFTDSWGRSDTGTFLIPSAASTEAGSNRIARLMRRVASLGSVAEIVTASFDIDSRHVLPGIRVPTLVLSRDRYRFVPPAQCRYLADHIAGARFVELSGADSTLLYEDADKSLKEIEAFVTAVARGAAS